MAVIDHPSITHKGYTTEMISWWDGGLHFFESAPAEMASQTIIDTYYFSYFLVFFVGWFIFKRWLKRGSIDLKPNHLLDLGLYCLLGVLIGAKTAYVLFYNLEFYLQNPSQIFLNWSGMSSHGAFVGVLVAIALFCRRFKYSFLHICDYTAFVGVLGPIFIRAANFLNGELYGRSAGDDLPWAMRFPMKDGEGRTLFAEVDANLQLSGSNAGKVSSTVYALQRMENGAELNQKDFYLIESEAHHAYELPSNDSALGGYLRLPVKTNLSAEVESTLNVRQIVTDPSHPSQIYQLGVSGVLLLVVLIIARCKAKFVGEVFGVFLAGYGVTRIAMEYFRQPDPQRSGGLFEVITMGQLLSLGVVLGGIAVWVLARKMRKPLPRAEREEPARAEDAMESSSSEELVPEADATPKDGDESPDKE